MGVKEGQYLSSEEGKGTAGGINKGLGKLINMWEDIRKRLLWFAVNEI